MDDSQKPVDVVNVLTPSGELVGLASHDVDYALQSGYQMAGPEHIEAARANQQTQVAPTDRPNQGRGIVAEVMDTPYSAETFHHEPKQLGTDPMAAALAQSPAAKGFTRAVGEFGSQFTPEGIVRAQDEQVERMRTMQQALKSGDFKAASGPAVEMAMSAGMGLLNAVGPKAVAKPLPSRFSVMTAENPSAVKLSREQNTKLLNKFKRELEKEGIEFEEVKGKYGSDENSILIPHSDKVNESFVNQLGKKYNQESVIHHAEGKNKLRFVSGEKAGMSHRGEGLVEAPNAEDNFTIIGGKKYQMPLDFDKTHPETLVHYSRSEKPLETIDPAFEGTGSVGKEAARKDRVKRSNYYEIGTEPEDIVVGSSRTVHYVERPENILDLASEEAAPLYKRAEELADFPDDVPTIVEKLAAQSGYAGIKNSAGHNPAHVALFEAQPVSEGKLLAEKTAPAAKATGLSKEELKLAAAAGKLRAGKPSQLTGVGEEIVLDDAGEPIAKLINGHMVTAMDEVAAATPKAPKPKKPAKLTLDEMPDRESPFFHKSEEIVNEKMGASATPEQIRGMLKEVKPEEVEWLGLEDFLKGKGKVSKQELMDHIAGNRLELKEVVKDGESFDGSTGNVKFSDYQLTGGENYREMLFQLPEKENVNIQPYRSSHWDEPNVLAHTRVNDRTIDGKKTLFIEEIQSDWHQAGRKSGYKSENKLEEGPLSFRERKELRDLQETVESSPHGVEALDETELARYNELTTNQHALKNYGVPDAPLKKTWHENVFKRMVREAAEKGYDQVAWTTGATQNARYPAGGEASEKIAHGMEGFYDKILPEYANKFGKKFGAKVEQSSLGNNPEIKKEGAGYKVGDIFYHSKKDALADIAEGVHKTADKVHVMKITPEMKKAAMKQGFSMFAMGGMAGGPMGADLKENYSGKNKKRKGINYVGYADGGEVELPSMESIDQQFAAAQAAPSPFASPLQSNIGTQMPEASANVVNVLTPTGELVGLDSSQVGEALAQGYRTATDLDVLRHLETQKYGTPGQQVLTGVEGAAEGLLGPIATGAEEGLSALGVPGISATDRTGRARTNPFISGASEFAGFVGPAIATMGGSAAVKGAAKLTQAGLIASAEKGAAKALGLESASGFVKQIGEPAVKGAFGAALYQGGQEISDAFNRDPNQTAQSAIADIGLAGVLGGVFGGAFGAAAAKLNKPPIQMQGTFVSEMDRPALEAGNFEAIVKHSDVMSPKEKENILASLTSKKKNAPEIKAAAERLGAPVLEGMISDSPLIQKAEDSLINGAPTYSGIKRSALWRDGYNAGSSAADSALGEGSKLSKAELGNQLKQSISGRLKEDYAPIEGLYNFIKTKYDVIPVDSGAVKGLANELSTMRELALSPKSPEGQLIKRAVEEIGNLSKRSLDDVKFYRTQLNNSISQLAATPGEKRMMGIISGKLTQLEEDTIVKYAKAAAASNPAEAASLEHLFAKRLFANAQNREFMQSVERLSDQLGKGRIHGLQDALNFINDRLTPEEVATRLFSKKDSEFLKFFSNNFPEEMTLVKNYQKQVLREKASAQGVFSPIKLFNEINKLEPEIKAELFDKAELSRLADAELYLRNFPKKFNPSGTSEMNAFREFMKSPTGAAMGNLRDAAIESFIKLSSLAPEIGNATALGQSTVKGWNAVSKASKALFDPAKEALPSNVISIAAKRDSLKRLVDTYAQDPAKFMDMNDNNPVPEYSAAFSMTGLKAVEYLNSIKPVPEKPGLLNQEMPLTQAQKAAYDRQVALAQQPLLIYGHLKHGTLVPEDLVTLKTIYPDLYTKMSNDIMASLVDAQAKKKTIPYPIKMSLSMFLGQPLDFSMTPAGIIGGQPSEPAQEMPQPGQKMTQKGGAALSKMPNMYETPSQSRAQRAQK